MLTQRSLLRAAALPLILPTRSWAIGWLSGGSVGPCGSPTPVSETVTINTPGCYSLQPSGTPGDITIFSNNTTLLGNGITVNSLYVGSNTDATAGIVVQNLIVAGSSPSNAITAYGNNLTTQTTVPAVQLTDITVNNTSTGAVSGLLILFGSNALIERVTLNGYGSPSC